MSSRLKWINDQLKAKKLEGLLVTKEANVSYLSELEASESALLISPYKNFLITDFRYLEQAKKEVGHFEIRLIDTDDSLEAVVSKIVKQIGIKRLGFESKWLSYEKYKKLKGALKTIMLTPTLDLIENLRQIKEEKEIRLIRKAIDITVRTFKYLSQILRNNLKEIDIVAELERFIRLQGAYKCAFDAIIASGPRTSQPHAKPSTRTIRSNEPILMDIGVEYCGYNSDLTRTLLSGRMGRKQKRIYDIVLEAKNRAIERIKPGIKISDVDRAARKHIVNRGLGKFFGHPLGHGVGKEVHEEPSICPKAKGVLQAGMVFTIEPAIYIPRQFGIREEDMILVTDEGCEILSKSLQL